MTVRAEDFENELTRAVRSLPSPEPTEALLAQILEDRKNGHRIELPATLRPAVRPIFIGIAAAAAALALWVTVDRHGSSDEYGPESSTISEFAVGMGLWPDQLYGQAASTSQLTPISPRDGSLLKAGHWVYSNQHFDEDGRLSQEHASSVWITLGSYRDIPAWLFIRQRGSANPAGLVDTVWLSRDSLHPLARFFPLMYGASLSKTYTGDSIIQVWHKPGGEIVHTAAELPSPRLWDKAAVSSPYELLPLFLTTRLDAAWRGSYAGTTVNNGGELVTFWWDLKVTGTERITVPAGTFDCWKVASMYDRDPSYLYWVDRTTGWIIREGLEPAGVFARVLVSHAAN